jgi:hypothetical protein
MKNNRIYGLQGDITVGINAGDWRVHLAQRLHIGVSHNPGFAVFIHPKESK